MACQAWIRILASDDVATLPALELYAGEHWDVARSLSSYSSPANRVVVWVCSAGYGLIPINAPIRPYSATFAPAQLDSIPGGRRGAAAWWTELTRWEGPVEGPRSLRQLVDSDPGARFLFAMSATYLAACRHDVLNAARSVATPSRISVISAGTAADSLMADFLLPADARLQHTLGGTRGSLNARIAGHLLASGHQTHDEMKRYLTQLLEQQPALRVFNRKPLTDELLRAFIREGLDRDGGTSATRLLRQLRGSGHACEQRRFARLFQLERERS